MKKGRIIILSGPSGAGKTTLHDRLLKAPGFAGRLIRSISATTRKPRGRERHGREYLFLSQAMFKHKIRTGQFLECNPAYCDMVGYSMEELSRRARPHYRADRGEVRMTMSLCKCSEKSNRRAGDLKMSPLLNHLNRITLL